MKSSSSPENSLSSSYQALKWRKRPYRYNTIIAFSYVMPLESITGSFIS